MTEQAASSTPTQQQSGSGVVVQSQQPSSGDSGGDDIFESNLARIREEVRQEGFSVNGSEETRGDQADGQAPAPEQQQANSAQSELTLEQRNAERRARLARLHQQNREKVDEQQRHVRYRQEAEALAAERKAREELEARIKNYVDPSSLDARSFLALAEKAKVHPDDLAAFIQRRATDPEGIAAEAAQRALDPKLTAAEQRIAQLESMVQSFINETKEREVRAEEQRQTQAFVHAVAQTDGIAGKFLRTEGPDQFLQIAERAARMLPPGSTQQDLYDQIEDLLENDGRALYQSLHSIYGASAPSNGNALPPNRAAAKATNTVTNQIAQERASMVEEGEFWRLPFEERLNRLKKAM